MILPPKRFQDQSDPKYDPIRHKPWFAKLARRRAQIKFLEQAYMCLEGGASQKFAADEFRVDTRELRDYVKFTKGYNLHGKEEQYALNIAYARYSAEGGRLSFTKCLEIAAPICGIKPRHLTELWEVDSTFYPQGYK